MPAKYSEKSFLLLLCISLLFHLLVGTGIYFLPTAKTRQAEPQATMVELNDLNLPPQPEQKAKPVPAPKPVPRPKAQPAPKVQPQPVKRLAVPVVPVRKLPVLPAERVTAKSAQENRHLPTKAAPGPSASPQPNLQHSPTAGKPDAVLKAEKGGNDVPRGGGLLKRQKGEKLELAKLFPTARRMESLEESYRNKYRNLEGGDTRMIDTNDPLIGTYSHRLYLAAQESYSFHTQSYHGGGIGVVQVTIARDGSVEEIKILEPSNRPVLDKLLVLAIRKMSYVGPLPQKWPYDKYKVIWTYIAYPDQVPY